MEFWIWIAIMIVVAIVKSLGQLKGEDDDEEPTAPARRVRPRQRRRPTQQSRRPSAGHHQPPVVTPPPRAPKRQWEVQLDDLQEFLGRLENTGQPSQPPLAAPPPLVETIVAPTRHTVAEPASTTPAPARRSAPPTTSRQPTRGRLWAEALRDRQNIRNIVLAAEIIGPPKSLNP